MPSEVSEEVAADASATHTPVSNPEGPALVEEVEQTAPLTTLVGPGGVASWADASEVDSPELPAASTSATQVKEEEQQEAESLGAVLATIGVPEEVADDPVATEDTEAGKVEPVPVSAELAPGEIAAEAAFSDLDRAKEEAADDPVSSPSEHVPEVETTDLLGLDDTEPAAVGDPAPVEPSPTVADPPGVATEATTADTSDLVPPPTSPNLVEPGTEPVRVGLPQQPHPGSPAVKDIEVLVVVKPPGGKKLLGSGGLILRRYKGGCTTILVVALLVAFG